MPHEDFDSPIEYEFTEYEWRLIRELVCPFCRGELTEDEAEGEKFFLCFPCSVGIKLEN